jgi:hypothetical protein
MIPRNCAARSASAPGPKASPVYAPLQGTYRQSVVLKFVQKRRLSTELTNIFFRLSYNAMVE